MARKFLLPAIAGALLVFAFQNSASASDLNTLLQEETDARRTKYIDCKERQLKQNYTSDILVENGRIYKGLDCHENGAWLDGFERWEYVGDLDKVETEQCQLSGNIQRQWTLQPYGRRYQKLVQLRKYNNCKSQWGTQDTPVEVDKVFYPVNWHCSRIRYKDPVMDPYETGRICQLSELR